MDWNARKMQANTRGIWGLHVHTWFWKKEDFILSNSFQCEKPILPSSSCSIYWEASFIEQDWGFIFIPELKNSIATCSANFFDSLNSLAHFECFFLHSLLQVIRIVDRGLVCNWSEGDSRFVFASKVRILNFGSWFLAVHCVIWVHNHVVWSSLSVSVASELLIWWDVHVWCIWNFLLSEFLSFSRDPFLIYVWLFDVIRIAWWSMISQL